MICLKIILDVEHKRLISKPNLAANIIEFVE